VPTNTSRRKCASWLRPVSQARQVCECETPSALRFRRFFIHAPTLSQLSKHKSPIRFTASSAIVSPSRPHKCPQAAFRFSSNQDGIDVDMSAELCPLLPFPPELPSPSTTRFNLRRFSISDRSCAGLAGAPRLLPCLLLPEATACSTPCFLQLANLQRDYITANRPARLPYSSMPQAE
jgi:hypothetical protein